MKFTLITGGAGGLGKEFAKICAKNSHNIILVDINQAGLMTTKQELLKINRDINVVALRANLANMNEIDKLCSFINSKNITINNLINAAQCQDHESFKMMNVNKQINIDNLNCNAPIYLIKQFLQDMINNNEGHIFNVCSTRAFYPGPYLSTYHATMSYLLYMGEAIAYELKDTEVKLLTLCPGKYKTIDKDIEIVGMKNKDKYVISSEKVAKIGYNYSLKGKSLKIIGFINSLKIFAFRFMPCKLILRIEAKTLKKGV